MTLFTKIILYILVVLFTVVLLSAVKRSLELDHVGSDNKELSQQYELLKRFNSFPLGEFNDYK